ncbi:hypothetical protein F5Y01DRAFT_43909 [Xylaria sp. FL0043]|nr:hypothetical protein F5Y01DRAFT_43909 [Xylaria sp. FL0043]
MLNRLCHATTCLITTAVSQDSSLVTGTGSASVRVPPLHGSAGVCTNPGIVALPLPNVRRRRTHRERRADYFLVPDWLAAAHPPVNPSPQRQTSMTGYIIFPQSPPAPSSARRSTLSDLLSMFPIIKPEYIHVLVKTPQRGVKNHLRPSN